MDALKKEPLTRETASETDENDSLWPHERFFSSLVFATVAHSALSAWQTRCSLTESGLCWRLWEISFLRETQVTGSNTIVGMVSRLINISPLNDPPEVRLTRTEVGFTEGSELVLIDPNMVLYDADSLELVSVTVQITDGYEQGEVGDSLECTQTPSLLTDDRCGV